MRFDGWILGVGTSSGTRVVVGHWPRSPFGPVSDVMVEHADGHRLLLAPQPAVAEFIATTYTFDQITLGPVTETAGLTPRPSRPGHATQLAPRHGRVPPTVRHAASLSSPPPAVSGRLTGHPDHQAPEFGDGHGIGFPCFRRTALTPR